MYDVTWASRRLITPSTGLIIQIPIRVIRGKCSKPNITLASQCAVCRFFYWATTWYAKWKKKHLALKICTWFQWFSFCPPICLSVCLSKQSSPLCIFYKTNRTYLIFIHLINQIHNVSHAEFKFLLTCFTSWLSASCTRTGLLWMSSYKRISRYRHEFQWFSSFFI